MRDLCREVVDHQYFTYVITFFIIIAAVLVGIDTNSEEGEYSTSGVGSAYDITVGTPQSRDRRRSLYVTPYGFALYCRDEWSVGVGSSSRECAGEHFAGGVHV